MGRLSVSMRSAISRVACKDVFAVFSVSGRFFKNATRTKKYIEPDVRNARYLHGISKEQLQNIQQFYKERYGGTTAK